MVMVAPALNPKACWEFEGEILVLHHPTTISVKYQAMSKSSSIKYRGYAQFATSRQLLEYKGKILAIDIPSR